MEPTEEPSQPADDWETFSQSHSHQTIAQLTPPPKFQEALDHFPKGIQNTFEKSLHGKLVGIWPINNRLLIKSTPNNTQK